MSTSRDIWLKYHPATRLKKINKKVVLPAFTVSTGRIRAAIDTWYQNTTATPGFMSGPTVASDPFNFNATDITFECWLKQFGVPAAGTVNAIYGREFPGGGDTQYFALYVNSDNKLVIKTWADAQHFVNVTSLVIPNSQWCHIAVSFSAANGGLRVYFNGQKVQTIAHGDELQGGSTDNVTFGAITQPTFARAQVRTLIDEVRWWFVHRTDEQIADKYNRHVNGVSGDSVEDSLEYFPVIASEGDSTLISAFDNYIIDSSGARITREDYAPIKFGGSLVAKIYTVTLSSPSSLVFPVERPDGANYGLYVSYQDDDNNTHRFRLFSADPDVGTETIHIPYTDYNGERLPTTFKFEFWNIDGEETVDLEDDLEISLSLVNEPADNSDLSQSEAATPVGSTSLAISTGVSIANPLTPNQAPTF